MKRERAGEISNAQKSTAWVGGLVATWNSRPTESTWDACIYVRGARRSLEPFACVPVGEGVSRRSRTVIDASQD